MAFRRHVPGLAILLNLLLPAMARAADPVVQVEPLVTREAILAFIELLGMDREQRGVVEMTFSLYEADASALAQRTVEAQRAAGADRLDEARAGRALLDPAEVRRLRVAVKETERGAWASADALFEGLLSDIEILIDPTLAARSAQGFALLRRNAMLAPRRLASWDSGYAGEGMDLVALVAEARSAGAELAAADENALTAILGPYAQSLDAHLRQTWTEDREGRYQLAVARIERATDRVREEELEAIERWRAPFELNRSTAAAIGAVAQQAGGPAAAIAWQRRVDRAAFPWLYAGARPERQVAWIRASTVGNEVKSRAEQALVTYQAASDGVRQEAISLLVRARVEGRFIMGSEVDLAALPDRTAQDLYRELLQNSGRRAKLDDQAAAEIAAMLEDRIRAQMNADLAASAFGRRR